MTDANLPPEMAWPGGFISGVYQANTVGSLQPSPMEIYYQHPSFPLYHLQTEEPILYPTVVVADVFVHIRHLEENFHKLQGEVRSLRSLISNTITEAVASPSEYSRSTSNSEKRDYSSDDNPEEETSKKTISSSALSIERKRRKYVRKPKPDPNAPVRPRTGYAAFSTDIRKEYTNQNLSFAEIASRTGKDWQHMDQVLREAYMSNAAIEKTHWDAEIAEYEKTEQHAAYQRYVARFKQELLEKEKAKESKAQKETCPSS